MNAVNPESKADRFLRWLEPIKRDLEVYCRRMIWDQQEVPDALNNAIFRAVGAFDRCWDSAKFRAWMFKILTHEILALNHKHARIARFEFQMEPEDLETVSGSDDNLTDTTSFDPAHWEQNVDDRLSKALKVLTDAERAVLLLRAIGNFKYGEISEELNIPVGSVMGYLARARKKMQKLLERPNMKQR
jgi:RNA polymerase sigma-70 factor, ECF subfamily